MKQIKNIIFDVGNVLFKYYPEYIIKSLIPNSPHTEFYLTTLFNSDIWTNLDKGTLTEKSAITELSKRHDLSVKQKLDISLLITNFYKHLILDEDMKSLFIKCTQNFNVYILSNFQSESFGKLKSEYSFLSLAKGEVVSANVRMIKPELGIYHYLLSQEKILPEQSIFIDDMKNNIAAAKRLLIKTIHHKNATATITELDQLTISL
jgi:FMN phosphatase YigB (HAD superfamily)